MSRRDEISMDPAERRELYEAERIVVCASNGVRGVPHVMPLWYVVREPEEIWAWTFAKSQKVRNLERDPRAALLIEAGTEYHELRGAQLECEVEIVRDLDRVLDLARELTIRYAPGDGELPEGAEGALRAQAPKRVALRFVPGRIASWDHRKLGGTY